jgi:Na+-transporting methylmalonyl-CoA/oxaloacetate decarboxylase gamma subunit
MIDLQAGIQHINDGQGVAIAVIGMTIVFSALSLISIVITLLPRVLRGVAALFPEPVVAPPRRSAPPEDLTMVAAAAAAHHAAHSAGPG